MNNPSLRSSIVVRGLGCLVFAVLVPPAFSHAAAVPYDLAKFRPVLDDSKLQAPTSSPSLIEYGNFAGKSNAHFHLDPTESHLVFTATGDGNRSELRQMSGDWRTSTLTERSLTARVSLTVPQVGLNQFTFMQIHDTADDGGLNKPLIRLTWQRSLAGKADHLWAAIRTPSDFDHPISPENLSGTTIDLGPRPTGFFDAAITVRDGGMRVTIGGQTLIDRDVSYWNGLDSYFKAGVYLQDPGTASVVFDKLAYGHALPEPASAAMFAGFGCLGLSSRSRTRSLPSEDRCPL